MTSTVVLPLGSYANQTRVLGPISIADNITSADISVQRCTTATPTIWPNASTQLSIKPEISLDNEVSWIECGASVSVGGIALFKGSELAFARSGGSLPPAVNGITRRYRCTVIVTGGPIVTSATFETN